MKLLLLTSLLLCSGCACSKLPVAPEPVEPVKAAPEAEEKRVELPLKELDRLLAENARLRGEVEALEGTLDDLSEQEADRLEEEATLRKMPSVIGNYTVPTFTDPRDAHRWSLRYDEHSHHKMNVLTIPYHDGIVCVEGTKTCFSLFDLTER